MIKPMAIFFELNEKETAFWTELVYFGRAKTDKEALDHYEKMQVLKGVPLKRLESNELEFYRCWYYNAIRSVIGISKFKNNYKALAVACTIPITAKEAIESVALLKSLKMIKKNFEGIWIVSDSIVNIRGYWRSDAVIYFQRDIIF